MSLKFSNTKTVDVSDWDDLVSKTYGRPYSFQQQDGCKDRGTHHLTVPSPYGIEDFENDSVPEEINGSEMGVSFKAWLERDPEALVAGEGSYNIRLFWDRNFYPHIDVVAQDLYEKGLIEAGDYVIDIDW